LILKSSEESKKENYLRGFVENIAYSVFEQINYLNAHEQAILENKKILVSGGISKIDSLIQYLATLTEYTFVRVSKVNTSGLGVAIASMGEQVLKNDQIKSILEQDLENADIFYPEKDNELAKKRYKEWLKLKQFAFSKDKSSDTPFYTLTIG